MYQRNVVLTLGFMLFSVMTGLAQSAAQSRIQQATDERMVPLRGNIHPLARPEFDRGPAPESMPAERMLLVLRRAPEQEAELQQLLEDQQTKSSPRYHQWLTPEEFGLRFGPPDADIAAVTIWLQSQGFRVNRVAVGRTVIEFSGTAGQVRQAFRTEIHKFVVHGEEHWANANDPQIPAALAPVVRGIVSLHNFRAKPLHRTIGKFIPLKETREVSPLLTTTSGCGTNRTQPCYAVGPGDFATIYNVLPLWNAGIDGTGQSIAIVARSNINLQDIADFRALFGLPANSPSIILDGPDPGLVPGDESEAVLDAEWAGGVAKGASIKLVVSESTEVVSGEALSALYVVDNNLTGVLSVSFGLCEAQLGRGGNAFFQSLWQQAAAQGITVSVSAGDPGSAGCDDFNTETVATKDLAVSGFASTPFNVAVGGTDFDDVGKFPTYWNSTNSSTRTSALSYIPELTWNDSCAQQGVSGGCISPPALLQDIVAGSGGPSTCGDFNSSTCKGTAKPSWQAGSGVPADNVRDIPDISLFAGDGLNSSFYVLCEADLAGVRCVPGAGGGGFFASGGTSVSAQAFAGIMALVNHRMATQSNPAPRQGNANFVLYPLAAKQGVSCNSSTAPPNGSTCIFYDITKGNNSVPCAGSTNCRNTSAGMVLTDPNSPSTPAWTTRSGYDLATGLGSINVANLANNWNTVGFRGTTTTLNLSPTSNIPHGTTATLNIGVTPSSGSGTPTGAVSLLGTSGANPTAIDGFTLTNGTTGSVTTRLLPGGSYSVFARYAGDGTFAASDSAPTPVTVSPEPSRTFLSLLTFDLAGNFLSATRTTAAYGSPYVLRADVSNGSANPAQVPAPLCNPNPLGESACPTGNVAISANGLPLDAGTFRLNSAGFTEDQPVQLSVGTYAIAAHYSGDNSFNPSDAAPLNISITKASAVLTGISAPSQPIAATTFFTLSTTVQTQSNGAAPTGTVAFFDGSTALTGSVTQVPLDCCVNGFASLQETLTTSLSTVGTHSITATYSGDTNYLGFGPTPAVTVSVTSLPGFTIGGAAAFVTAGSSGIATITLTPSAPFNGQIMVSCPTASLPPGVTCDSLNIVVSGGGAATGQLTVRVAGPSSAGATAKMARETSTQHASVQKPPTSGDGWRKLAAATGLAGIFLFFLPGRRRYRARLALWVICALSFVIGCGGGGGGGSIGPVATITKITASQTKAPQGTSLSFNIAVTSSGAIPAGTVQLFDGAAALGSAMQVTSGAATISTSALGVGTHAISAHYSGDSATLASRSGAVNVSVTGTTTVGIATNPASSNSNASFTLTIN